jgi:hypothetical protein
MEVESGSRPFCGLENRRPKGYAGSSPVPSAIASFNNLPRCPRYQAPSSHLPLGGFWRDLIDKGSGRNQYDCAQLFPILGAL